MPPVAIDWSAFLRRHDLVWPDLPLREDPDPTRVAPAWGEGAFLGNGMIGAMITRSAPGALRWELGHNAVEARNHLPGIDWSVPRVPIGDVLLEPAGGIAAAPMRLHLWEAEVAGTIRTGRGAIAWRSLTHATTDVLLIEVTCAGDEPLPTLHVAPAHGVSPRLVFAAAPPPAELLPPPPEREDDGVDAVSLQRFLAAPGVESGACALAWRWTIIDARRARLHLTIVADETPEVARAAVLALLRAATDADAAAWEDAHRAWWHGYYPASLVSLPDTRWESVYWIQMYKLACATRAHAPVIDNQGPWLTRSRWPGTWWNLNVQLSYAPLATANRLELGESLIRTLVERREVLRQNARPLGLEHGLGLERMSGRSLRSPMRAGGEFGNLTWALFTVWGMWRTTMDDALLRDPLFPLLRGAIETYLHVLTRGDDGRLHLPAMTSPEYPGPDSGNRCPAGDTNYDLALLRWGCAALLETCARLGLDDERQATWRQVLAELVPEPEDEHGLRIAADLPLAVSHRHYSHLFAFYPLHLRSPEEPHWRRLLETSLAHWIGFTGALQGYSYTGAACMAATLQDGDRALALLDGLRGFLLPNTMYAEAAPVIETPLSSAEAIHYLLLQSWDGVVRVFPAIPAAWREVLFAGLRAQGGFLVSAERRDGATRWVRVTSLAGEPLVIRPGLDGPLRITAARPLVADAVGPGTWRLELRRGETALLHVGDTAPMPTIAPVASQPAYENWYGMRRGSEAGA